MRTANQMSMHILVALLILYVNVQARPPSSFEFHPTKHPRCLAFTPPSIWLVRAASAVTTYVGFVAVCDRPQGDLLVDQEKVEVKASSVPGAGLGLFAKTRLPKGAVLGTYPGVVLPLQQNLAKLREYPWCEGYIWRFSDNKMVIDPTDTEGVLQDVCVGGNPGQFGSVWIFQTLLKNFFQVPTTLCRINEPPRGKDVNVITSEDLGKRQVTFELERDVQEGEEFFIDYGLSYDRSQYGPRDKER